MGKLTQERLKELLHYDPKMGVFRRAKTTSWKSKKGTIAGHIGNDGYRRITVGCRIYKASRLAWLYMEGYWPENEIDHADRVRHNDTWENLRHVSRQCNSRNCDISKNNKSGITGISWGKTNKKWKAQITISGKNINLGRFRSKLSAVRARWNAEVKHNFLGCQTTSSAYLYLQEKGRVI
ncbi:HNH endonuclease [Candidatus Pacearchaeota archaeon]|nr:HNH endonuclease [Candidatus Pacearchaeota archaeon]